MTSSPKESLVLPLGLYPMRESIDLTHLQGMTFFNLNS